MFCVAVSHRMRDVQHHNTHTQHMQRSLAGFATGVIDRAKLDVGRRFISHRSRRSCTHRSIIAVHRDRVELTGATGGFFGLCGRCGRDQPGQRLCPPYPTPYDYWVILPFIWGKTNASARMVPRRLCRCSGVGGTSKFSWHVSIRRWRRDGFQALYRIRKIH